MIPYFCMGVSAFAMASEVEHLTFFPHRIMLRRVSLRCIQLVRKTLTADLVLLGAWMLIMVLTHLPPFVIRQGPARR